MADHVLDLRQLAKEAAAPVAPPAADKPLVGPTTTFNVKYVAPDGTTYEEPLTSKVPTTVDSKAQAGRMLAKLAGAQRFDDMPESWRLWAVALVACTLQVENAPDWFLKWVQADERLLFTIYNKLCEHEALFFRAVLPEGQADASALLTVSAPDLDRAAAASG